MRQWDIYLCEFGTEQPHPAVLFSSDQRCGNPDLELVNVPICTSVRLNRGPKPHEFILDEADGLDWKTAARCDLVYTVEKSRLREHRGHVSLPRRAALARHIFFTMRLPLS